MSYIDGNRPAPFGAITIYRATEAVTRAADVLQSAWAGAAARLASSSPARIADVPADRRRGSVAGLVSGFRRWEARRRTIAELERLSDAQLDDIGLNRGRIELLRLGRWVV